MQKSDTIAALVVALVKAQSEFQPVIKTESATIAKKNGGSFGYQYADLNTVIESTRPALLANGLAVMQFPTTEGNKVITTTMLTHVSGEYISETLTMTVQMDTPQSIGSAITYSRRYAYMACLGLAAADDDGAAASKKPVVVAEPAGYTEFKLSMILAGREGMAELKKAWEGSSTEHKGHARKNDLIWWNGVKSNTAVAVAV